MIGDELKPAILAELVSELARIFGDDKPPEGYASINYGIPLSSPEKLLTLLRGAPSGIGIAGLQRYVEDQLPQIRQLRERMEK